MHQTRENIDKIRTILKAAYPDVKTQLSHKNPFELLIATILSAQCTDRQVNAVTGELFSAYPTPASLAEAQAEAVEARIRSTGFYRHKAKNIQACARKLVSDFAGEVPESMAELLTLPGVGRKTANVVRGAAFGIPGIVVDTHVARISRRLDLTHHDSPEDIERDLMRVIPKDEWNPFSLWLIYFGRDICRARTPGCPGCPVASLCPFEPKTKKK